MQSARYKESTWESAYLIYYEKLLLLFCFYYYFTTHTIIASPEAIPLDGLAAPPPQSGSGGGLGLTHSQGEVSWFLSHFLCSHPLPLLPHPYQDGADRVVQWTPSGTPNPGALPSLGLRISGEMEPNRCVS